MKKYDIIIGTRIGEFNVDKFAEGKFILYISKGKLFGKNMIAPNTEELFQKQVLLKNSDLKIMSIFDKIYPYPMFFRINK